MKNKTVINLKLVTDWIKNFALNSKRILTQYSIKIKKLILMFQLKFKYIS